jgi:hypothetical protein
MEANMWVTLKKGSWADGTYRFDQGRTWCTDRAVLAIIGKRAGGKGAIIERPADGEVAPAEGYHVKQGMVDSSGPFTTADLANAERHHTPRVEPEPEPEPVPAEKPAIPEPDTEFPCRFECGHDPYKSEAARERHEASKHGEGTEEEA